MSRENPRYLIRIVANVPMTPHMRDRSMNSVELEEYRRELNRSYLPGGVNFASLRLNDVVPHVSKVFMVDTLQTRNSHNRIVASAQGSMFEVVS